MSCSPFDLKDYFFQELPSPQRLQVEVHLKGCLPCRQELESLQLTGAALFSVRDEEIPQRIAFVSDQIFEPSPWRRWFSGFWGSTARLGFASAALLSASVIYFAATRPAPAPDRPAVPTMAAGSPSPQQIQQEIQQQIQQAVSQAVREAEARQDQKVKAVVAALERGKEEELRSIRWMIGESDAARKRSQLKNVAMYVQPSDSGEVK